MKIDKASLIRTIILIVALLNQTLVTFHKSPLPFDNQQLESDISIVFTIIASLVAWWKHNFISKKGRRQKAVLKMHDEQVKK